MTKRNLTKAGQVKLGQLVEASIEKRSWTQKDLLSRLAAIGHNTTKDKISRLINAVGHVIDGLLVLSIADLEICCDRAGKPYDFRDLMLIACEEIDPTVEPLEPANSEGAVNQEAVNFLREKMGDRSVEQFAQSCRINVSAMSEILAGRKPTLAELIKFGILFPDRSPLPLARMYGLDENAVLNGDQSDNGSRLLG